MAKTINSRNVHEAFILGMDAFTWDGDVVEQDSRAGATLEFLDLIVLSPTGIHLLGVLNLTPACFCFSP